MRRVTLIVAAVDALDLLMGAYYARWSAAPPIVARGVVATAAASALMQTSAYLRYLATWAAIRRRTRRTGRHIA